MKFPKKEEALRWYHDLGTPENIIRHVLKVNQVANFLARELAEKGADIDLNLVDSASLLHDLDKWICLQRNDDESHGYETERMLQKKGYPKVGFVARQHRGDNILKGFSSWEEKIVAYSDKIVLEDNIVPLKERFNYINIRYPAKDLKIRQDEIKGFYMLEKEIFSRLDFTPEELKEKIEKKN